MSDRFVVVPAAFVFLLREGASGPEVLLQLRRNTGFMDEHWAAAAAGHVEKGETAYAAARREAVEELGVTDLALEFVTSMQRWGSEDPIDQRIDFYFTARSWSGEPRVVEPHKCAQIRWCPLTALPDPVVPHEGKVLTALQKGCVPAYTTFGFQNVAQRGTTMSEPNTPRPEPVSDGPDPEPGGADSLDDPKYGDTPGDPVPRDLDPDSNPAVEDHAPEEIKEQEDKVQEPRKGHSGVNAPGDEPAGTSAEEDPEPPA